MIKVTDPKDSNAVAANRIVLAVGFNTLMMVILTIVDWFVMR